MGRCSDAPYPYSLLNDVFNTSVSEVCDHKMYVYKLSKFPGVLSDDEILRLNTVLQDFGAKDRAIVIFYYKDKMSMRKIGEQFGLTAGRIQQIIKMVLRKLRHPWNLKRYWDDYSKWSCDEIGYLKNANMELELDYTFDIK